MPSDRVQQHLDNAASMPRSYARNGYWWTIVSCTGRDNMLEVVAEVRERNRQGAIVLARTDALNPMCIVNPISMMEDGTRPNPQHNPRDRSSRPTIPNYRKDLTEAFRLMLDRHLAMKAGQDA